MSCPYFWQLAPSWAGKSLFPIQTFARLQMALRTSMRKTSTCAGELFSCLVQIQLLLSLRLDAIGTNAIVPPRTAFSCGASRGNALCLASLKGSCVLTKTARAIQRITRLTGVRKYPESVSDRMTACAISALVLVGLLFYQIVWPCDSGKSK